MYSCSFFKKNLCVKVKKNIKFTKVYQRSTKFTNLIENPEKCYCFSTIGVFLAE